MRRTMRRSLSSWRSDHASSHTGWRPSLLAGCWLVMLAGASLPMAPVVYASDEAESAAPLVLAQAEDEGGADAAGRSRSLEPRYQPREPEEKSWYNGSYIFGMTRGVANSTIAPAGKVPLFVLTVPLDIAFFPFALIGGMFG